MNATTKVENSAERRTVDTAGLQAMLFVANASRKAIDAIHTKKVQSDKCADEYF